MAKRTDYGVVSNLSFTWEIVDYDFQAKEYTIKNKVTGEERKLPKERLLELLSKQGKNK
jgi:hypothetical protein